MICLLTLPVRVTLRVLFGPAESLPYTHSPTDGRRVQ